MLRERPWRTALLPLLIVNMLLVSDVLSVSASIHQLNSQRREMTASDPESLAVINRTMGKQEVPANQSKTVLSGHKKKITVIAFSPDRSLLATGSDDKTVKLWKPSTGELITTLAGHQDRIYDLKFSPDGRFLATLSYDKKPKVWNVATGQLQATLLGHKGKIYNLDFSPDGQTIVTGSDDGTAILWDALTGKPRATLTVTKYDGLLKRTFLGDVDDLIAIPRGYFNPDGKTVLTVSGDRNPKLWDAGTGELIATLEHNKGASQAFFSPDGSWVATESNDDIVRLWDSTTGRLKSVLSGHLSTIYDVKFSPDGMTLATGSLDRTARLWEVPTGRLIATLGGYDGRVPRVAFSPDSQIVATKGGQKLHTVKLWDVTTGRLLATLPLPGHGDDIEEIGFSPDGRKLVSSSDKTVEMWDVKTGQLQSKLAGARNPVTFSPDGKWLASAGTDNTALLWNLSAN